MKMIKLFIEKHFFPPDQIIAIRNLQLLSNQGGLKTPNLVNTPKVGHPHNRYRQSSINRSHEWLLNQKIHTL